MAIRHSHPFHPVNRWFVVKIYNFPVFSRVVGTDEIMNRAGSVRIAGLPDIPLRAHSNLNLSVAIDIARSNRDVVELCKVFRHDEPLAVTIAIPYALLFVGEQHLLSYFAFLFYTRPLLTQCL